MEEAFAPVALVTFSVLVGIVALMVGLEVAGVAQVREQRSGSFFFFFFANGSGVCL